MSGSTRVFSKRTKLGGVCDRDEVELGAEGVDEPAGDRQRRRDAVDAAPSTTGTTIEADAERGEQAAGAAGAAGGDLARRRRAGRRRRAWSATGQRSREVGCAVVDDRHRDAVAEVVGRERDQPGVAEVQHAVVADDRLPPAAVGDLGSGASTLDELARGAYQAPSVSVNSAGTTPTTTAAMAEQPERLAPPERAPGDVVAERGDRGRRRDRQAEADRRQQDADLGDPERQRVAVLQHGEAEEHDDEAGGARRPRQAPRPGDEQGDQDRHVEDERRATSKRPRPIAIDATSTRPRPGRRRAAAATRSFHDHVVDHGRLSTHAPAHATSPRPAIQPRCARRRSTASVVSAEHDGDDDEHRQHGRGDRDGDGRRDGQHAVRRMRSRRRRSSTPSTRSAAARRRVGGADADGDAQQVHEPRHGGVGDEGAEADRSRSRPGTSGSAA